MKINSNYKLGDCMIDTYLTELSKSDIAIMKEFSNNLKEHGKALDEGYDELLAEFSKFKEQKENENQRNR
jgi:hypothetical protein